MESRIVENQNDVTKPLKPNLDLLVKNWPKLTATRFMWEWSNSHIRTGAGHKIFSIQLLTYVL